MVTTLTGTLQDYGRVEMFFRQVQSEQDFRSEVVFRDFSAVTGIHLLNFLDIGSIVVDGASFRRVDELDVKYTRNCLVTDAEGERVRVKCNKESLFYNNIRLLVLFCVLSLSFIVTYIFSQ